MKDWSETYIYTRQTKEVAGSESWSWLIVGDQTLRKRRKA